MERIPDDIDEFDMKTAIVISAAGRVRDDAKRLWWLRNSKSVQQLVLAVDDLEEFLKLEKVKVG